MLVCKPGLALLEESGSQRENCARCEFEMQQSVGFRLRLDLNGFVLVQALILGLSRSSVVCHVDILPLGPPDGRLVNRE